MLIEQNNNITVVNFAITSTKLYLPDVTLSVNYNINVLENVKQRFKRTISWNNYRSKITTQSKNNNLDYLFDPTFREILMHCLYFHSKMVMMFLREVLLKNIKCHWKRWNVLMH